MKRVLLININRCKYPYPVYPLGMSHVANALAHHDYNVKMFDMGIQDNLLEDTLMDFVPDFIGLSMRNIDDIRIDNTIYFIPELNQIMKRIRNKTQVPVILGGSAYSLFPDRLLKLSHADYGIISEGENAIVQLIGLLSTTEKPSENQLSSISGLVYRDNDSIKLNTVRPLNPSQITFALRDQTIESYYRDNSGIMNIQTQRGCPCRCCYCTYPLIEGSLTRYRPAEQVVSEIIEAKKQGNYYFFIVDSVFNTNREHVTSICEEMIRRKADIKWGCFLKPSNLSNELMKLMARAGLTHIEFGSDSFCDTVLYEYCKDFTFDDIFNTSEWARTNNIYYAHFLITGGPGETELTLQESFENSRRLKKTVIFPFTGMRLFPGTSLYKRALKENIINDTSDCLEPLFYISPSITKDQIKILLKTFQLKMPNWIIDDVPPEIVSVMSRLRTKGIYGPLWEFLIR